MAQLILLSIDELETNQKHSIKLTDRTIPQRIRKCAETFGQLQCPVVIKNLYTEKYSIIKGRAIAQGLMDAGELFIYCFVIDNGYSEESILLAYAALTTLQQKTDSVEMAYLVHDLLQHYTKDELVMMLDFTIEDLTTFEALFDFEWNKIKNKKHETQVKLF